MHVYFNNINVDKYIIHTQSLIPHGRDYWGQKRFHVAEPLTAVMQVFLLRWQEQTVTPRRGWELIGCVVACMWRSILVPTISWEVINQHSKALLTKQQLRGTANCAFAVRFCSAASWPPTIENEHCSRIFFHSKRENINILVNQVTAQIFCHFELQAPYLEMSANTRSNVRGEALTGE